MKKLVRNAKKVFEKDKKNVMKNINKNVKK